MSNIQLSKVLIVKIAEKENKVDGKLIEELIKELTLEASLMRCSVYKPTELGKKLTPCLSAQKVNNLLQNLGYQVKVGNKWWVTELGEKYAVCRPYFRESKNGIWTIEFDVAWKQEIIELLEVALAENKGEAA